MEQLPDIANVMPPFASTWAYYFALSLLFGWILAFVAAVAWLWLEIAGARRYRAKLKLVTRKPE